MNPQTNWKTSGAMAWNIVIHFFYVFIQIWIWWSWASTQGMSPKMAFNPLFPVSAGFKLPSFEQCPVYTSGWVLSRMVLSCIV
jgi:hypothetical protein